MRTLTLQLVGITPILLHHTSRHQLRKQIASHKGVDMSLEDEAYDVMMKDENGNPTVPVSWLWDALRVGCSRITVEGKQVSFFRLQSAIHLPALNISLMDTDNHIPIWKVYSSIQHASPESKRSIAVVAPMFNDWMLAFNVMLEEYFTDIKLLQKVFVEAGKVGIGLFHPPKKQFGQFGVTMQYC